jgi:hypothetical protein
VKGKQRHAAAVARGVGKLGAGVCGIPIDPPPPTHDARRTIMDRINSGFDGLADLGQDPAPVTTGF